MGTSPSSPPTQPTNAETPPVLMPDVVCMSLQDAQDTIQSAGVFFSRSDDATGDGRMQVVDDNWQGGRANAVARDANRRA